MCSSTTSSSSNQIPPRGIPIIMEFKIETRYTVEKCRGEHLSKTGPDRNRFGLKRRIEDRTEMVRSGPGWSGPRRSSVRKPVQHIGEELKGLIS
nr:hypothetical protein [Tanacetum cinerariifolium]